MTNAAVAAPSQRQPLLPLRRVLFWSLLPLIVIVPLWFMFGRFFLGGEIGWLMVFSLFTIVPIAFVFQIIIAVMAFFTRPRGEPHALSMRSSIVLLMYLVVLVVQQFFQGDFGDVESRDGKYSAAERLLGIPTEVATASTTLLLLVVAILALAQLGFLIADIARVKGAKKVTV